MAITLTGTNGLFTRLGFFGGQIQALLNMQGNQTLTFPAKSMGAAYTSELAQFTNTGAQSDVYDGYFNSVIVPLRAKIPQLATIKTYAQTLLIRQVNDDTQLKQKTLPYAWQELIRQMGSSSLLDSKVSGCTVAATTPSAVTGITNTGTPIVTSSKTGAILPGTTTGSNAMDLQLLIPETVKAVCTTDAQAGGASQYQEVFTLYGTPNNGITDPLTWNYTTIYGALVGAGSNITKTMNVCNAAVYANAGPGGNLLQNGDFKIFINTPHQPDNWVNVLGTPGTDYTDVGGSTSSIVGTQCLVLLHTGTALSITQQFGVSTGTLATLLPNTVYAINLWAMKQAGATGTIEIALIDGSGNVINDNNGTANSFTLDLSTLDTTYTTANGPHPHYFRTPAALPAIQKLRLRTTVGTGTANSFISHLAMKVATQLYPGGGYVDIFSGATASIAGDTYQCPFTNNYGGVGTGETNLQTLCNWLFDVRSITAPAAGLFLPIVGTTLINDTLIS